MSEIKSTKEANQLENKNEIIKKRPRGRPPKPKTETEPKQKKERVHRGGRPKLLSKEELAKKPKLLDEKRKPSNQFKSGHIGNVPAEDVPDTDFRKTGIRKRKRIDLKKMGNDILRSKKLYFELEIDGKEQVLDIKSPKTMFGALMGVLIQKGMKGNVVAAKEVLDRCIGRPSQSVEKEEREIDIDKPEELNDDELEEIIKKSKS